MRSLWNAPRKKRDDEWQQFAPRYDEMSAMRGPYDPAQDEPTQKKKSFMEGGDFGWRDGLGLALAGIGDAFTREGGGEGGALNSMIGRAYSARDMAKKAQTKAAEDAAARQASAQRIGAARPDLTPAQIEAISYGDFTPDQAMPKQPKDDVFTAMMRHGGIDPESDEGKALYKQRAATMANPPMYTGWDNQRYGSTAPAASNNDGWESVTPEEEAAIRNRQGGAGPGQRGFRR